MIRTIIRIKCGSTWRRVIKLQNGERFQSTAAAAAVPRSSVQPREDESWSEARPYTDIPGPRPLPLVGNVLRFMPGGNLYGLSPLELQETLFKLYGPIVRLSGLPGRGDMVFLFDPEDVCKLFRSAGSMPIRDSVPSIYYYRTAVRPEWFEGVGGGLVAQGEEWYNFRTKVNRIMLQPKSVQRYVDPIDEVAHDFADRMHELRDEKRELPGDFQHELFKWGLESAVVIALDMRLGCLAADASPNSEAQRMIAATQRIFDNMNLFLVLPFLWRAGNISPLWRQFVRDFDLMTQVAIKYTYRKLQQMEAERAAGTDTAADASGREPSVLEHLLRTEQPQVAAVLAADIFTGGTETTAKTLATALTNLARYPHEQSALAEELRRELPDRRPRLTSAALARLPRLRAFLKESMRVTPTVPASVRTTTQNLVLSGYQVPQGTEAIGGQLLMSRQNSNVPRATEFLPERWLQGSDQQSKGHPFASLPFGFGNRMCIGRRFAELQTQVLIAKIVHRYTVEYHYGEMPFQGNPMYSPSGPLKFRLLERD